MGTTDRDTAVGVFPDRTLAEYALEQLLQAGFSSDQVGLVVPDAGQVEPPLVEEGTKAAEGAAAGAAGGAVVGGLVGAALVSISIPGVGPVLAAGLLAGALGGAAAGMAGGSLLGALVGLDIPETEAGAYAREFHSGRSLVTVRAGDRYEEAMAILRRANEGPPEGKHRSPRRLSRREDRGGEAPGTGSVFVPRP